MNEAMHSEVIRMKSLDPQCRFRLDLNIGPIAEEVATVQERDQGLEAPESHFVDETAFKLHFGRDPMDHEIVFEDFNGVRMKGVSCLRFFHLMFLCLCTSKIVFI